jgi:hypothetical protein
MAPATSNRRTITLLGNAAKDKKKWADCQTQSAGKKLEGRELVVSVSMHDELTLGSFFEGVLGI